MSIDGLRNTANRTVSDRTDRSNDKTNLRAIDPEQNRRKKSGQSDEAGTLQALLQALLANAQSAQQPAPQPNAAGGDTEGLLQKLLQLLGLGNASQTYAKDSVGPPSNPGAAQMIDEGIEGPQDTGESGPNAASTGNGTTSEMSAENVGTATTNGVI